MTPEIDLLCRMRRDLVRRRSYAWAVAGRSRVQGNYGDALVHLGEHSALDEVVGYVDRLTEGLTEAYEATIIDVEVIVP